MNQEPTVFVIERKSPCQSPVIAFGLENPSALGVIALLALLFFGHKLPQVARSLGSSVSEFKKGVKAGEEDANNEVK